MGLFVVVIIIVVFSFLGAVELSTRSYELKEKIQRMDKKKGAVLKTMKIRKRRLDFGTVLFLVICAGTLLIYASYE